MLESASARLCEPGGAHHGSPDKRPGRAARDNSHGRRAASAVHHRHPDRHRRDPARTHRGAARAARAARDATGTSRKSSSRTSGRSRARAWRMRRRPTLEEHLWTIAVARLLFPPAMNIQAPPNLSVGRAAAARRRGINDWGGVSPVTPDHVNPEAPWPHLQVLERATNVAAARNSSSGSRSTRRTRGQPETWVDPALQTMLLRSIDGDGWPRTDDWSPGLATAIPPAAVGRRQSAAAGRRSAVVAAILERASRRRRARRARDCAAVPGARRRVSRRSAPPRTRFGRTPAATRLLRRHAQHQLHERLHVQVPVLRVLERQTEREPARQAVHADAR